MYLPMLYLNTISFNISFNFYLIFGIISFLSTIVINLIFVK